MIRVDQDSLKNIELFPRSIAGDGYLISVDDGIDLKQLRIALPAAHKMIVLLGMPNNGQRSEAVVRKFGAVGISGLQRFFKSRFATYPRRLTTGKEYIVDALDLESMNIADFFKSTNGLRGPNLGLIELICIPESEIVQPGSGMKSTVESLVDIANRSEELFSGSLDDNWGSMISKFAYTTLSNFGVTILKAKDQLSEEQYLIVVRSHEQKVEMLTSEESPTYFRNLIILP